MQDDEHNYQAQINACNQKIMVLRGKINKERARNRELRQTITHFNKQSSQTQKVIAQIVKDSETANTTGKQFITKKTDIIDKQYNKNGAILSALGSAIGVSQLLHGSSANNSNSAFEAKSFGYDMNSAQEWGRASFKKWNDELSVFERQAITDYKKELYPHSSSYYVNMNNTLRNINDETFRDGNQLRYLRIHQALQRSRVPEDVVAYRGVSQDALREMMQNAHLAGFEGGLRDNAFMSCSLFAGSNFNNYSDVIMRLTITQGSNGAFIANIGNLMESECELLLDCGSSIFITDTRQVPRSEITGNPYHTDMITLVEGVVEA